jgi:hypothetical protein
VAVLRDDSIIDGLLLVSDFEQVYRNWKYHLNVRFLLTTIFNKRTQYTNLETFNPLTSS